MVATANVSALHGACGRGDRTKVLKLLDAGADVNSRFGFDKCIPLLQAAKSNRIEVVDALLSRGADAELADTKGWTPLLMASFYGYADIVRILLSKGVSTASARPSDDFTALHLALAGNHPVIVRMLVEAGADVDAPNKAGQSPLGYCQAKVLGDPAYTSLVRLLEGNAKEVVPKPVSPLAKLVKTGYAGSPMRELVMAGESGADRDGFGNTVLHTALMLQKPEDSLMPIVRELLNTDCPIDALNKEGMSGILLACKRRFADILQKLIKKGADVNTSYRGGENLLHVVVGGASWDDKAELMTTMLIDAGCDPNKEDEYGVTPVHLAAERARVGALTKLVDAGGQINKKTKAGDTLLQVAASSGNAETIRMALTIGADPFLVSSNGETALHLAAAQPSGAAIVAILEKVTDCSIVDAAGNTALHIAASKGMEEPLRELTRAGMDPNSRNSTGATALMISSFHGYESIVDFLVSIGASSKVVDDRAQSALHFAVLAKTPSVQIVGLLLESGADPKAMDNNGNTPLDRVIGQLSDNSLCQPHSLRLGSLMGCVQLMQQYGGDIDVLHKVIKKSKGNAAGEKMMALLIELGASVHTEQEAQSPLEMTMGDVKHGLMSPFDGGQVVGFLCQNGAQDPPTEPFNDLQEIRYDRSPSRSSMMSGTRPEFQLDDGRRSSMTRADLVRERSPSQGSFGSPSLTPSARGGAIVVPPSANRSSLGGSQRGSAPATPQLRAQYVQTPSPETLAQREILMHGTPDRIRSDLDSFLTAKHLSTSPRKHNRNATGVDLVNRVIDEGTMTDEDIIELIVNEGIDVSMRGTTGRNPMYYAAQHGRQNLMKELIGFGVDLEDVDEEGTLLHKACGAGKPSMVQTLIQIGSNPSTCTRGGRTALMVAAAEKTQSVTEVLARSCPGHVDERDPKGLTALHYAAQANRETSVVALLRAGADPNAEDISGCTPLMLAAYHGYARCVEAMVQYRASVNECDVQGRTAAHWAVGYPWSNPAVIAILVQYGASCNIKDEDEQSPLDAAVKVLSERKISGEGAPESVAAVNMIVTTLIDAGAKPNIVANVLANTGSSLASRPVIDTLVQHGASLDEVGAQPSTRFPIQVVIDDLNDGNVARSDAEKMICFLVEKGADINLGSVKNGDTAMHQLMRCHGLTSQDKHRFGRFLIERCRACLNLANNIGETPLSVSLMGADPELVTLLVAHGADVACKDDEGSSAMDRLLLEISRPRPLDEEADADLEKHLSLVSLLLANGADPNVLQKVIQATHGTDSFDKLATLLIKNGADVNRDLSGLSPVQFTIKAMQSGALYRKDGEHVIQFLLDNGADINMPTNDNDTPLHLALQRDRLSFHDTLLLCEFLLERGANVSMQNKQQVTPVFMAVDMVNLKICELLVDKYKASVGGRDKDGNTALIRLVGEREEKKVDAAVLEEMVNVTRFLLCGGLEVDGANKWGETALLRSIGLATSEVLVTVLELGANPDKGDKRGKTPFRKCFEEIARGPPQERMEVLQHMAVKLIEFGCNFNVLIGGLSPLSHAVKVCDLALCEMLCAKGVDVMALDHEGYSILERIVMELAEEPPRDRSNFLIAAAKLFIGQGAPVELIAETLRLTGGSKVGLEFVLLLLEAGANINATDSHSGCTPVHTVVLRMLDESLTIDDGKKLVKWLAGQGADINALSETGRQDGPLHSSAIAGNAEVIDILLKEESALVNHQNGYGDTALKLAAESGQNDAIDALIAGAGDVNQANFPQHGLIAPIHAAGVAGKFVAVQKLVQGQAEISQKADLGKNVLHLILELGPELYTEEHKLIALDLIKKNGNFNLPDDEGDTCLRLAIMKANSRQVALSLIQAKADLNSPNKEGKVLLNAILAELATLSETKESFESDRCKFLWFFAVLLIERGADVVTDTALGFEACKLRSSEMLSCLLDNDTPPNTLDEGNRTMLNYVVGEMCEEAVDKDRQFCLEEMVEMLMAAGADVNVGEPLIFDAVRSKKEFIVAQFIDKGASVTAPSSSGITPLAQALIQESGPSMVELLLKNGADANITIPKGGKEMPAVVAEFERAISTGGHHFENVRLLVANGADVNWMINERTPFDEILFMLKGADEANMAGLITMASGFIAKGSDPNVIHKVVDITKCKPNGNTFVKFLLENGAEVDFKEVEVEVAAGKGPPGKGPPGKGPPGKGPPGKGPGGMLAQLEEAVEEAAEEVVDELTGDKKKKEGEAEEEEAVGIFADEVEEEDHAPPATSHPGTTPVMHVMSGLLHLGWGREEVTTMIKTLADAGADINMPGEGGNTPLHTAVLRGNIPMCIILMNHGANPNSVNDMGDSPVIDACKGGNVMLVESISQGANWSQHASPAGMSLSPLHIAAAAGNRELTEYLLRKRAPVNNIAYWRRTPMHLAIAGIGGEVNALDEERFTVLSLLMSAKGSDVNVRDVDGESPLSLACGRGAWRSARVLLSRGADPRSQGTYPSCLARAIDGTDGNEIVNMIIKSAPECAQEAAALIAGIRAGNEQILKSVMSVGGTCYVREGAGFQQPGVLVTHWAAPLWWSCYFGQAKFIEQLLSDTYPGSVHVKDSNGMTLLHWCAIWGAPHHNTIAAQLIERGANVNARDSMGQTPLHLAAKYGRQELMAMFTEANADVEVLDNAGLSVMEHATKSGASSVGEEHPDPVEDAAVFIEHFMSKGSPYFDASFGPSTTSLASSSEKLPAAFREIQWLRPAEITWAEGPGLNDGTSVGAVGHAWFPATVGLAGREGYADNLVGEGGGAFCVKCVGADMEEHKVVVDDFIPCIDGRPAFTNCTEEDFKALIIEKAYAKLFGSYEALLASWSKADPTPGAEGQEIAITDFATSRLRSLMCSPIGRRMKENGELSLDTISNHFAGQEMPNFSPPIPKNDTDGGNNAMTSVGSHATGCNPSYSVVVPTDGVLLVTVSQNEGAQPLTGSVDVYSETGASWMFVGSKDCNQQEGFELEVPVPAAGSPYIVLPSLGPDSGYTLEIAATVEVSVRPMMGHV